MKPLLTLLLIGLSATVFATEKASLQIFMAGDSTMSIKDEKDYPETGWGVPFDVFFDPAVSVHNLAKNGRSTRTFIEEGLWQSITDNLRPGDYVFIQFGHNDQSEHKQDRYTAPAQYQANLRRFIADVRTKEAHPLLLTPVTRRYFTKAGVIEPTHRGYDDLVRQVARTEKVVFLDMEKVTREYFTAQGDTASKLRFMHIAPDLHPNYPIGVTDDTHFNALGAREVAQLVLTELKKIDHPLAHRLRVPDPKHLR